jgi:hypothetical protein
MNKAEASSIAEERIGRLRGLTYASLAAHVDQHPVTETVERHGVIYHLQTAYHWDSHPGGNVRVIVAVDDGGIRAFVPFTSDFIKSPSGQFVGE